MKADKSDTLIIMDKEAYRDRILKEHLHTATYEKAPAEANSKVFRELNKLCAKYNEILTKGEKRFIINDEWNTAYFYGLPKIHKSKEIIDKINESNTACITLEIPSSLKMRPICGGPRAVTQGVSRLLHEILSPLVPNLKSHIKDEWDFVRRFPKKIDFDAKLLSCDIVSLYSSIPIELGLEALEYWIEKLRHVIPQRFTKTFILEMAKFVLENNYCEFDSQMYRQIVGTAMGTIFAPPYACLVIGFLEETILYRVRCVNADMVKSMFKICMEFVLNSHST